MDVLRNYPDRIVILPLNKLGKIIYQHFSQQPSATVNQGYRVISVGQDDGKA